MTQRATLPIMGGKGGETSNEDGLRKEEDPARNLVVAKGVYLFLRMLAGLTKDGEGKHLLELLSKGIEAPSWVSPKLRKELESTEKMSSFWLRNVQSALRMIQVRQNSRTVTAPLEILVTSEGSFFDALKVGSSSYPVVFGISNKEPNKVSAIKVIEEQQNKTTEIDFALSLKHPFIVNTFTYSSISDMKCLWMDFADELNLLFFIRKERYLSESQSRSFFLQILSAVHFLHSSKRLIHRDIKPENILLDSQGFHTQPLQWRALLADFGAATTLTHHQIQGIHGTLYYAAPEILRTSITPSCSYQGEPVDVWSLGVVLYSMIFGTIPWPSLLSQSNVTVDQTYNVVSSTSIAFPLPTSLACKNLILQMLRVDPQKRITIAQIKNHPWLTHFGPCSPSEDLARKLLYGHSMEPSQKSVSSPSKESLGVRSPLTDEFAVLSTRESSTAETADLPTIDLPIRLPPKRLPTPPVFSARRHNMAGGRSVTDHCVNETTQPFRGFPQIRSKGSYVGQFASAACTKLSAAIKAPSLPLPVLPNTRPNGSIVKLWRSSLGATKAKAEEGAFQIKKFASRNWSTVHTIAEAV